MNFVSLRKYDYKLMAIIKTILKKSQVKNASIF
jgi:hypothetical protein